VRSTNNENPVERKLRELFAGLFRYYGFIDKRFLEIQEASRRVSFFVAILVVWEKAKDSLLEVLKFGIEF